MDANEKTRLLRKIIGSKELTALEKRYLEGLIRGSDYAGMPDAKFMTDIICRICDFAVANHMPPTDTVRTLGENLEAISAISDFDNWKGGSGDVGKDT